MAEFFRVVRVRPNGTEQILRDVPVSDVSPDAVLRAEAYADGRTRRASGQHIRVYTSSGETVSPGDVVWDSEVND